jgi:hypothetical protein
LNECARLLAPDGQALVAVPMDGSFQEVFDLLREFALKYEADDFARAVERPTMDVLGAELRQAGF